MCINSLRNSLQIVTKKNIPFKEITLLSDNRSKLLIEQSFCLINQSKFFANENNILSLHLF
jgi:hypothetical protein